MRRKETNIQTTQKNEKNKNPKERKKTEKKRNRTELKFNVYFVLYSLSKRSHSQPVCSGWELLLLWFINCKNVYNTMKRYFNSDFQFVNAFVSLNTIHIRMCSMDLPVYLCHGYYFLQVFGILAFKIISLKHFHSNTRDGDGTESEPELHSRSFILLDDIVSLQKYKNIEWKYCKDIATLHGYIFCGFWICRSLWTHSSVFSLFHDVTIHISKYILFYCHDVIRIGMITRWAVDIRQYEFPVAFIFRFSVFFSFFFRCCCWI